MNKNKTGKYLIYAIGEIVLVVIGILIALQINNRNESKKTEAKVEAIFADILEELSADIEKTTNLMHFYAFSDSTMFLVLNNRLTRKDYDNNEIRNLWGLTSSFNPVNLSKDAYNNLIEDLDAIPIKYNDVLKDLSQLYNRNQKIVNTMDKEMGEFVRENIHIRMRNYSWFSADSKSNRKGAIDFMMNDFRYKNEVLGYRSLGIYNQLGNSVNYRQKAILCYQKIAKLLNRPMEHESFVFDKEIAKTLVGDWYKVEDPKVVLSYYLKGNRLFGKNTATQIEFEVFYLPGYNKIVDTDLEYATIVNENYKTILKFNDSELKKVD